MKKALILNASHNDERMIRALKELNFYVISTGNASNLRGHKMCDEYVAADYSDKEKILELARRFEIDRICACCNDFGVITAAYVAEKLGLPGYDSYETTLILHNKDQFKKFADINGIATPKAESFYNRENACKYVKEINYPVMVKAADLSAGNGILKANNIEEALEAIDYAFDASRIKHIVIEPFLVGSQHGFCSFLINKKVVAYCSNNEYSIINPYRVEIDTFPAANEELVAEKIIYEIEKMAELLNLCDGIFHLQYIADKSNIPHILECMRRIPGGLYTIPAESISGINWDYWEVRAKCTDNLNDFPNLPHVNKGFYSYKCFMANKNGKVADVLVDEELKRHQYGVWTLKTIGDKIVNYKSTPVEYRFCSFGSMNEMLETLIGRYDKSCVITE